MKNNLGYKISDKALINISNIEKNIAIMNQTEVTSKTRTRVLSESMFDDLFAISAHLGLNLTLGDIKRISLGKDIEQREARILSNIRQVFDFVKNNFRQKDFNFNFHLIQHVVKLLQSNVLEVWDIGKIRNQNDEHLKLFELEEQKYSNDDLTNLFADAIMWIESEENVHPIVKACIFFMLINTNSPFVGLNYLASLMFLRLILEKYGYGTVFSIPLFKILSIDEKEVFRAKVNSSLKTENGITEIIETVSDLLSKVVLQYKNELVKFDYFDIRSNTDKVDLNERQVKLLKLLQQKVFIRRHEYVKLFKVSPMTAYRDLNYLVEKKLLHPAGSGKATTYSLSTR